MAISPAAVQPPKPPPPPKTEAAGAEKKDAAPAPKPAEKAAPAPRAAQLRTPDTFELASGGRAMPSNGSSSFSPAVSNALNSVNDAYQRADSILSKASVQNPPSLSVPTPGFQPGWGGSMGPVNNQSDRDPMFGGAAGGIGEIRVMSAPISNFSFQPMPSNPSLGSLQDLLRDNFGGGPISSVAPSPGSGPFLDTSFIDSQGGGSKPGVGSGIGMAFLDARGGGAGTLTVPTSGGDRSISFETGRGNGHSSRHFGFDFGSRGSGGGGAAGGIAERW